MSVLRSLVLYTALALTATAATQATAAAREDLEVMREGLMRKLIFHETPREPSATGFTDRSGGARTLADYRGKYVLLNFWATWCTPCRKEMPSLDRLQAKLGGERFEVVTVATGRNALPAIDRFFRDFEITRLPVLLDASRALAADFGALSLPVTMIIDPQGREIARLIGDAEWDSDSAVAILSALIAQES